ncbi:MAG: class I SAM-dependent methyltransferase [Halocynthiibacter sp.]
MEKKRDLVRRKMLETLPKNGKCAEIGVWEGKFSSEILAITTPKELHLIDPWEYMPEFSNTGFGRKKNADAMSEKYEMVKAKFNDDKRVKIHRATSEVALGSLKDGSLDWVYIDGNHNEPFISNDLNLALEKVAPNGVIAGDDFYWEKENGAPIKTAVHKLLEELAGQAKFERFGQQYVIRLKRG